MLLRNIWCAQLLTLSSAVFKPDRPPQSKYLVILQGRAKCIEDTEALRGQNTELKMLLNEYLGSKINHDLHVPPTSVIPSLAQALARAQNSHQNQNP